MAQGFVTTENVQTAPIVVGSTRVTPVMRVHTVRWKTFGLCWKRPVRLHVDSGEREYDVPIWNVTRRATCMVVALMVLFAVLIRGLARLGRS